MEAATVGHCRSRYTHFLLGAWIFWSLLHSLFCSNSDCSGFGQLLKNFSLLAYAPYLLAPSSSIWTIPSLITSIMLAIVLSVADLLLGFPMSPCQSHRSFTMMQCTMAWSQACAFDHVVKLEHRFLRSKCCQQMFERSLKLFSLGCFITSENTPLQCFICFPLSGCVISFWGSLICVLPLVVPRTFAICAYAFWLCYSDSSFYPTVPMSDHRFSDKDITLHTSNYNENLQIFLKIA